MCFVYENGANISVIIRIIKKKRMNVCVHDIRNELIYPSCQLFHILLRKSGYFCNVNIR